MRCGVVTALVATGAAAMPAARDDSLAKLPDAAGVVSGYSIVRRWVDAFDAPKLEAADAKLPIENSSGACVILRRGGRAIGTGVDTTSDPLMLRRAAGKAMTEVLGDPALASISAQLQSEHAGNPDAALTVDSLRADLGLKLTLEIDVAGPLTPLIGRSLQQMARTLEPGVDGLAIRRGQAWQFLFPAQSRTTNTGSDPEQLLRNLAMQIDVPIKDLANLAQRQDIGLYSFRTIDLIQSGPRRPAFQTFRGDDIVLEADVSTQAIVAFADGVAKHVMASRWPEGGRTDRVPSMDDPAKQLADKPSDLREPSGLMGDYSIVADRYRPPVAPAVDQAMAAFALNRYANAPQIDGALATAARHTAKQLLAGMTGMASAKEDGVIDLASAAAIVYAVAEQPSLREDPPLEKLFVNASKHVTGSFDAAAGFILRGKGNAQSINLDPNTQAMLAGAMGRLLSSRMIAAMPTDAATVRRAIDEAWRSVPQPQQVALLPWIGWAEADYANATGEPMSHQDEMKLLIQLLAESQIGSGNRSGAAELEGGFALTEQADATARATSQSIRPAAWLAGIIGNADLTGPDQRKTALERQIKALRFLMQLSLRESGLASVRNPQRALGGIRAALWDSDEPNPAQCLGLIAAADTLRSLAERK